MSALRRTLPLEEGETVVSWASRLAQLHGRRLFQFCADMQLSTQAILDGDMQTLSDLARLGGEALDRLLTVTTVRNGTAYLLAGQRLARPALRREHLVLCPECLREDVARMGPIGAHARLPWTLAPIRTCATHGRALVDLGGIGNQPHMGPDFAHRIEPVLETLDSLFARSPLRAPSSMESHLARRLVEPHDGSGGLLDELPWHVAAKACEMVGAILLFGTKQNLRKRTEDDWYSAGGAGHDLLAGGRSPFFAFLDDLRRSAKRGQDGPQASLGRLYQWLEFGAPNPDFDPMRRIVAEHIVATYPMAAGEVVLGQKVERRVIHSIRSAAVEHKIHPKRLRKLLVVAGLAEPTSAPDDLVAFSAEKAAGFLADVGQQMTLSETKEYLATDRVHTRLLVDAGLLKAFAGAKAAGLDRMFLKSDLDEFLKRLFADAIEVEKPEDDMASIARAASLSNRGAMEIVEAILGGRLNWVGKLVGVVGYPAILVRVSEVKALLRGDEIDGLTKLDLTRVLRCSDAVAAALVDKGQLPIFLATHPVHRCPTKYVPTSEVAKFQETFVSLFELAAERGEHHMKTKRWLEAAGVAPALERDIYKAAFYRRVQLPP